MNRPPQPPSEHRTWPFKATALGLLAISALALLLAPLRMPAGYSWLRHTTSQSAAQGIPGAWLARFGFLIFGLTVLWMSGRLQGKWPLQVRLMHAAFGVLMAATAAFSTRPWLPDLTYDPIEDALHSFTATAVGFAFAIGAVFRLFDRRHDLRGRLMDLVAIVAATAIPWVSSALPEWAGLFQRGMFAIAYI